MKQPTLFVRPSLTAFGQQLVAARRHAKMTRSELARRAAMTRQGLIKIERGRNVTLSTIVLLANGLGCQVADFFPRKAPWD
jgi:transcriptional regulator with XRE-family HTH domain